MIFAVIATMHMPVGIARVLELHPLSLLLARSPRFGARHGTGSTVCSTLFSSRSRWLKHFLPLSCFAIWAERSAETVAPTVTPVRACHFLPLL